MAKLLELIVAAALSLSFNAQAKVPIPPWVDTNNPAELADHHLFTVDISEVKFTDKGAILYRKDGSKLLEDQRDYLDISRRKIIFYHPNGRLKEVVSSFQGELHGWLVAYHQNGWMRTKGQYFEGKKEGVWFEWYDNGQMRWFEHYHQGKRHGTQMMWNRNGKLSLEQNMINGELHGRHIEWNSDNSCTIGNYVSGKRHGERNWFNKVGKITHRTVYINDKLQYP